MVEVVPHDKIEFDYLNWKDEKSHRRIEVGELYYGSSEWHPQKQWLLEGYDLDKKATRIFALKDMGNVKKISS